MRHSIQNHTQRAHTHEIHNIRYATHTIYSVQQLQEERRQEKGRPEDRKDGQEETKRRRHSPRAQIARDHHYRRTIPQRRRRHSQLSDHRRGAVRQTPTHDLLGVRLYVQVHLHSLRHILLLDKLQPHAQGDPLCQIRGVGALSGTHMYIYIHPSTHPSVHICIGYTSSFNFRLVIVTVMNDK